MQRVRIHKQRLPPHHRAGDHQAAEEDQDEGDGERGTEVDAPAVAHQKGCAEENRWERVF